MEITVSHLIALTVWLACGYRVYLIGSNKIGMDRADNRELSLVSAIIFAAGILIIVIKIFLYLDEIIVITV